MKCLCNGIAFYFFSVQEISAGLQDTKNKKQNKNKNKKNNDVCYINDSPFTIRSSQCSWQDRWVNAVDFLPCGATPPQKKYPGHNNPTKYAGYFRSDRSLLTFSLKFLHIVMSGSNLSPVKIPFISLKTCFWIK